MMTTVMRAGDNATSDAVSTRSPVVADPPALTFRTKSTSSFAVYITTAGRKSASPASSASSGACIQLVVHAGCRLVAAAALPLFVGVLLTSA